ncbi:hypothetical protein [Azospirillum sp.]|uniref:hypothetical protein n=1 Tax=Azospirillum sp. TaxID=34012 RepID=UPI002607387B|nr:hypothetical protein [Azospirillum sp.]
MSFDSRSKAEFRVRELAQENTVEAVETLVEVMRTGRPGERLAAAVALLDRGWGWPAQAVEVNDTAKLSLVELLASIASTGTGGVGRYLPSRSLTR